MTLIVILCKFQLWRAICFNISKKSSKCVYYITKFGVTLQIQSAKAYNIIAALTRNKEMEENEVWLTNRTLTWGRIHEDI